MRHGQASVGFVGEERGAITLFVLTILLLLLLFAGAALDLLRYERARADLQNGLDRGVLAASNLGAGVETAAEVEALIADYMRSRADPDVGIELAVEAIDLSAGRSVSAEVSAQLDTVFLRLLGIDTLTVSVSGGAAQGYGVTEIVLVLDVSGSMTRASTVNPGASKLDDLRQAAREFVDTVLSAAGDRTFVSLVPYSAQVALPPEMAAAYDIETHHDRSYCVEYADLEFTTLSIPTTRPMRQAQHFVDAVRQEERVIGQQVVDQRWVFVGPEWWRWEQRPVYGDVVETVDVVEAYGCPRAANAIVPFSRDRDALRAAIDGLTAEKYTAAYMGAKWGAALLDPDAGPVFEALDAAQGSTPTGADTFDPSLLEWPRPWSDRRARKVMVLMTDGDNTRLNRVQNDLYAELGPDHFGDPANHDPSWKERIVDDEDGPLVRDVHGIPRTVGDAHLIEVCHRLKSEENAVVYTIGFEIEDGSEADDVLATCASSLSTYYFVDGIEIALAFGNIATELSTLKLME